MIYHREKLNVCKDSIESAVVTIYKSIAPHDVFVIATEEKHVDRMERMEFVSQCKFSKPTWIRSVNKNEGVIFTITSGMFRRKMDRTVAAAIEYVKTEFDDLVVDYIENQKFAVFFIGFKTAKKAKASEAETNEAIEPTENMEG